MEWETNPVLLNIPEKQELAVFIPSTGSRMGKHIISHTSSRQTDPLAFLSFSFQDCAFSIIRRTLPTDEQAASRFRRKHFLAKCTWTRQLLEARTGQRIHLGNGLVARQVASGEW